MKASVELGLNEASVTDISAAAGVSRRTFYGYFKNKEEAFLDAYERVSDFLLEAMAEAGRAERGWPARVRAELEAMLEVFAANPDLASFVLAAPPAAGGEVAGVFVSFLDRLLALLTEGRPKRTRNPGDAAEHGLLGGLAGVIVDEVRAGRGRKLPKLLPDLVELVLTPYLGRTEAARAARG
jgi:AcrR family transcriptional regulator